jgi:hypothetical protein
MVSEIWTWQEGERVYSRLTTNVCRRAFLARLRVVGLLDLADTIHAYFGDRVDGGNGYEILWEAGVRWDYVQTTLTKV